MEMKVLFILFTILINQCTSLNKINIIHKIQLPDEIVDTKSVSYDVLAEIEMFLAEGRKQIDSEFVGNYDNVLVLGLTGTGKTTVALLLTTNNDNLISEDNGAGEYIIKDETGLIGNEAIVSKTSVPTLFINPDSKVSYYDCPGFTDTRNMSIEISSTFFIHDVIERSSYLKFAFAIDYNSVNQLGSRKDFPELCKHISNLILDIDKYNNSISAIITKDNLYHSTDQNIINTVVYFLKDTRIEFETGVNQKPFYKDGIKFIDILLTTDDNGNYPRFSLFRAPEGPGPLSTLERVQKHKSIMMNMIYNETSYVKVFNDDFGYTLTDKTLNDIYELAEILNAEIAKNIYNLGIEIKAFYGEREKADVHLDNLLIMFGISSQRFNELKKHANEYDTTQNFLFAIDTTIASLDIYVSSALRNNITSQVEFIEFLQIVSIVEIPITPIDWIYEFQELIDYLNDGFIYYTFLQNVYADFSKYDYQRDTNLYNVLDLNDWGQPNKTQGIKVIESNFNLFVTKAGYINMVDFKPDAIKLARLNSILGWTLRYILKYDCTDNKVTLTGEYVKISDLFSSKSCYSKSTRVLKIYALHTLFINQNLNADGQTLQLSIIARSWNVMGQLKISLNGRDGNDIPGQAKDGQSSGLAGDNGQSGTSGTDAGHLLAIGEIQNVNYLEISIISGRGGNGQNGGNGFNAKNATLPLQTYHGDDCDKELNKAMNDKKLRKAERTSDSSVKEKCYLGTDRVDCEKHKYNIYSFCGGKGGSGGDGGRPGANGTVIIVEMNDLESFIKLSHKSGEVGKIGEVGKSYTSPYVMQAYCATGRVGREPFLAYEKIGYDASISDGCGSFNSDMSYEIENSIVINNQNSPLDAYDSINEYKSYVRTKLDEGLRADSLATDLLKMENKTISIYNTLGLVKDLSGLEQQYYQYKDKVNLLQFYESLLNRILIYSNKTIPSETNAEYRKVLNYIYTATHSKIISIKRLNQPNLIVDMQEYLEIVRERIRMYEAAVKRETVQQNKDAYNDELNKKIEEAMQIVSEQIVPEIDRIFDELDKAIDKLVTEIKKLQEEAEQNRQDLIKKRDELREQMRLRALLGGLKVLGSFMSMLGPYGQATGAFLGGASTIGESLTLTNGTSKPGPGIDIPDGVKYDIDQCYNDILAAKELRFKTFSDQIDDTVDAVSRMSDPSILNEAVNELVIIQNNSNSDRHDDDIDIFGLDPHAAEANKVIDAEKDKIKEGDPNGNNKNKTEAIDVLDKFKQSLKIANDAIGVYNRYKKDQAAIDEFDQAIQAEQNKINELADYEQSIYRVMIPMINGLRSDIKAVEESLEGVSLAQLSVIKWQTTSNIKDIQRGLSMATEGFDAQADIVHCLDKLMDAMETMINVYERIETYKEQQIFFDYLTNILITGENIQVSDPVLQREINKMDIIIDSNIILEQHAQTINGFQQSVFPFAHYYLDKYRLPTNITVEDSIDSLVQSAITQINGILESLKEYKSSIIPGITEGIFEGDFDSNGQTGSPFYVWKNTRFNNEISRLLNGEEISFDANALNEFVQYNSVKFSKVNINFKLHSNNDTLKDQLINDLNYFDVYISHLGNSYYRCDDQFYIISTSTQNISYSFEINPLTGEPRRKNQIYDKLMVGGHMLSPYTVWSIRLTRGPNTNVTHDLLSKYKNDVDLELSGRGQYVQNVKVCDVNLEYYYKKDDIESSKIITSSNEPPFGFNPETNKNMVYKFVQTIQYGSWTFVPINTQYH